jgi:hypothetical protein
MDDGRRVVFRILSAECRIGDDRCAEDVVRLQIGPSDTFVDHVGDGHGRVPAHVHANLEEDDHDTGVLAERAMSFGAHARVRENLRDRVLCGGRLLFLVRGTERGDVVERMEIRDVLQSVLDALDEIVLLDHGHGRMG